MQSLTEISRKLLKFRQPTHFLMSIYIKLFYCIYTQDYLKLKDIFEALPDIYKHSIFKYRNPLFLWACYYGNINICKYIKQKTKKIGINVIKLIEPPSYCGGGPIHYAAWGGHYHIIEWLLTFNDPDLTLTCLDFIGNPPIFYSIHGGHMELTLKLIKYINLSTFKNKKQEFAIIYAARGQNFELIKLCLEMGCPINAGDETGQSAILYATLYGNLKLVKFLLDNGSVLYEKNNAGYTPLLSAAYSGDLNTFTYLSSLLKTPHMERIYTGDTALLIATYQGHLNIVRYILLHSKKEVISAENNYGMNLMMSALTGGNIQMIKMLINDFQIPLKLTITCKSDSTSTGTGIGISTSTSPINIAISFGYLKLTKWLVHNNKFIKAKGDELTPFMFACCCGEIKIANWLLETGTSINEATENGSTGLSLAVECGKLQMVKWLITNGANIESANSIGYTSLLIAASKQNKEMMTLLMAFGANLTVKSKYGASILTLTYKTLSLYRWVTCYMDMHPILFAVKMGLFDIAKWQFHNSPRINKEKLAADIHMLTNSPVELWDILFDLMCN